MAKETEEKKVEETEQIEATEIPQEVLDANKKFDDLADSEDDSASDTDTEENTSDEKTPEGKAEEGTAKTDTGETKAVEQTAEEKEIEAEATKIEAEILADDVKREAENKVKAEAEAKVKAEAEKKAETDDEKPYDCGLDPEEFDEGYIKAVNKLGQENQDARKALKSENDELRTVIAQQGNQRYTDWLDSKINGLGEDFHEVFGEGEIEDIEPASEQFENRQKLASRMALVSKTYQKLGKPAPSKTKLFKMAVSYLHKNIVNKSKNEAETTEKLAARARQSIGPGSKKSSALSAEETAKQKQKDFDKKLDED